MLSASSPSGQPACKVGAQRITALVLEDRSGNGACYSQPYPNGQKLIPGPNLTVGDSGNCSLATCPEDKWEGFGQHLFGRDVRLNKVMYGEPSVQCWAQRSIC